MSTRPPEVLLPGQGPYPRTRREQSDDWMDQLAWWLEEAVPVGGRYRFGLDAIVGLIPGVGDSFGLAVSLVIIGQAVRMGAPSGTVALMLVNALADAAAGVVPILGDAFDFFFKANTRNLRLYREAMSGARNSRRDWGVVALVMIAVAAVVLLPLILVIWFAASVWNWF